MGRKLFDRDINPLELIIKDDANDMKLKNATTTDENSIKWLKMNRWTIFEV